MDPTGLGSALWGNSVTIGTFEFKGTTLLNLQGKPSDWSIGVAGSFSPPGAVSNPSWFSVGAFVGSTAATNVDQLKGTSMSQSVNYVTKPLTYSAQIGNINLESQQPLTNEIGVSVSTKSLTKGGVTTQVGSTYVVLPQISVGEIGATAGNVISQILNSIGSIFTSIWNSIANNRPPQGGGGNIPVITFSSVHTYKAPGEGQGGTKIIQP